VQNRSHQPKNNYIPLL